MRTTKSQRLFLTISVILLLSDLLLVLVSGYFDERDLNEELHAQGVQHHATYHMLLDQQLGSMLMLAHSYAGAKEIRDIFEHAANAVQREGGGAGGPESAAIRNQLYHDIAPVWEQLTRMFDVRQLHFHLGPGDVSFLRVHKPERFGDDLSAIRHTITSVIHNGVNAVGFETGRVYSGLRGVVPLVDSQGHRIGAVEVGTSFTTLLSNLSQQLGNQWAVLLTREHVESTMWADTIRRQFGDQDNQCPCKVESTTDNALFRLIDQGDMAGIRDRTGMRRVTLDGAHYILYYWPLRDYLGQEDVNRANVGSVVVWQNIDNRLTNLHERRIITLIYAIAAYIAIEVLLYFVIRIGTARLEQEVRERTAEVEGLNTRLREQANTDELTSLPNRRHLLERMEQELRRANRSHTPLSLLMIDLDHFKRVNDNYGHLVGDTLLRHVAKEMCARLRMSDLIGRYGGEEFCVVLPDTDGRNANSVAEELRRTVAESPIQAPSGVVHITLSIGIAQWCEGESLERWINRADEALYRAKSEGRDLVRGAKGCIELMRT